MNVLVVSPHPDDETLGCGGTLLRHGAEGDTPHWLIATSISVEQGYPAERVESRGREIEEVAAAYGFGSVHQLGLPTTSLSEASLPGMIVSIQDVIRQLGASVIYLPFRGDAHSDHRVVFDAAVAAAKWFRTGTVERLLCYEVLSETDMSLNPDSTGFKPNVFVDIGAHVRRKIEIMRLYRGEMGEFPFPRSEEAILALARYRGATAGFEAAEAFMLLRERR